MAARTLTIEFPETADVPLDSAWDQDLLRYAIAATLYAKGLLSRAQAQRLTGDPRPLFEEKMDGLGRRARTPEEPLSRAGAEARPREKQSRWAQVAEHFSSAQAGHLNGRSDEALKYLRDFRREFDL